MKKAWGYLVAIESDSPPDPFYLKDGIGDRLASFEFTDLNIKHVDVELMGEIDIYNEDGTKQEETN